ncbi:hypothetical protein ACI2K4_23635 [Micromonospora sp. NPDC050397]|uniref:hypothetical protein n=1 Tax=Micromonospora sp. NPDC050397 TaxID=3364279 RepID=UPI00384BAA3E
MSGDVKVAGAAAVPVLSSSLDYYLISAEPGDPFVPVAGILVEEFVFGDDSSTITPRGAGWTAGQDGWWDAGPVSRRVRAERDLRRRVTVASRDEVGRIYRPLTGEALPDEATLRSHFGGAEPARFSAPLRLTAESVPEGVHERRVYRILLADDLGDESLASLCARWGMEVVGDRRDPSTRVVGSAEATIGDDRFAWDLRRIGSGVAWGVDVTVDLGDSRTDRIEPLLRGLVAVVREQGLIPVAIERFS